MSIEITRNFDLADDLRAIDAAIEEELGRLGQDMQDHAIALLERAGKRASGDLIDSFDVKLERTGKGFLLRVGPEAEHAIFVEEDTAAHQAPIEPLKQWAEDKFGLGGRARDSLAYAVREKIAREGTKGIHYMTETFRLFEPMVARRLAQSIAHNLN